MQGSRRTPGGPRRRRQGGRTAPWLFLPALLAAAPVPHDGDPWRAVLLAPETRQALEANLQRTSDRLLAEHFQGIALDPPHYRVETDGTEHRVVFETVVIRLSRLRAWTGDIVGRIEIDDLVVRYGPLSLAKLDLLSQPAARIYVDADIGNLEAYLDARGVRGATIRFPEATRDLEFEGSFRVDLLFLGWNPRLRVRGEWVRQEERHVFELHELYVSRCPGFLRARIRTAVERVSRGGFGLQQGLALLTEDGMAIALVDLRFRRDGVEVYHKAIRAP